MRSLSPEEAELWARVTATIRPLSRNLTERAAPAPPDSPPPRPPEKGRVPHPRSAAAPPKRIERLQDATLDGSWDRRIAAGKLMPDRIIDLHGHSLDRAWLAIDRGLERAIASGDRVLLLITGHQRVGEPPLARGRIRAAVNDWLAVSRHSSRIASVRGAHPRHGGGGSLYIILRKP